VSYTHYGFTDLLDNKGSRWGRGSRARLATNADDRTALVFVHGFNGEAVGTWLEFPSLLPSVGIHRGHDLFFFGYASTSETAAYSASHILAFLDALNSDPVGRVINPSRPKGSPERAPSFRYQRIILCAHSLGAIVCRLALIQAARQIPPRAWPAITRLVLFAPAHMGASILSLASLTLAAVRLPLAITAQPLDALLRLLFPALIDLTPGSETLRELREDTMELLSKRPDSDFLRARVMHASGDRVVRQAAFGADYPTVPAPNVDHIRVCKPAGGYALPLTFVAEALV